MMIDQKIETDFQTYLISLCREPICPSFKENSNLQMSSKKDRMNLKDGWISTNDLYAIAEEGFKNALILLSA